VEHTSRDSPHFNGKVKRKTAVTTRRVKSALRKVSWGKAIVSLADFENALLSRSCSKPACVAFFERKLQCVKNFGQFGEAAHVKFGDKMKGKLANRGVTMMCLGCSRDHVADSHRFLNLAMDKVINSRDATWLNKVRGKWKGLSVPARPETATLLPVEAVKETKALSEKKGHDEEEREVEQEPKPLPCFSAVKKELERE